MEEIKITIPDATDAEEINTLIIDVFMKCVAPEYSEEGVNFFLNICKPEEILDKLNENTPLFTAKSNEKIVGIIWTKGKEHISRFFVDVACQRNGIGRLLFNKLLFEIKFKYSDITEITVNSSPFALKAYEKLGFRQTDEEKCANGMRYIPLVYEINR